MNMKMQQSGSYYWDGKFRLTQEQTDRLKLLETSEVFQTLIQKFRKTFSVDISRGYFDYPKLGISVLELAGRVDRELEILGKKLNLPYPLMCSQVLLYIKYNTWPFDPSFPEKFYEPSMGAPSNWIVRNEPTMRSTDGKVVQYSDTVSLITYARLSTKELSEAIKHLKRRQKRCFNPKLIRSLRHKRNIDRDLRIEKEMALRQPRRIKENLVGYLGMVQRERDKGRLTEKEFRKVKRMHPGDVQKVKTGKTSKEVAQEVLGSAKNAPAARTTTARLKKRRKELLE